MAPPSLPPAGTLGRAAFEVDIDDDVEVFLGRCERLSNRLPLPFHAAPWLRAWYATLGRSHGRRPVLVGVRSRSTGADLVLLPLSSRRIAGLSVVEFADAGVVDYQLPLGLAEWRGSAADARALWDAVRGALQGHDVLRLEKMLGTALDEADLRPNPLVQGLRTSDCDMYGNQSHAPATWDEWRHSLGGHTRREFERAWRVFTRSPLARFECITEPGEALRAFEQLEAQQASRMHDQGQPYVLDQPAYRAFFRQALLGGLADGSAVLTVLRDGEQLVAALFGVANARRFIALRVSTGGPEWAGCSPGRLIMERTACHLHARGVQWFDFGIGGYAYKAHFRVRPIALFDAAVALSWRGAPWVAAWRLRRALKRLPWLASLVRRARGVRATG